MSTKPHEPYSTTEDLEITADYPPPTPAAPTDTWVIPQRADVVAAEDPSRAHLEEIRTLRQSVAGISVVRDQLQSELGALTTKRHELEELLLTRDELLSRHERDLSAAQDEMGQMRERLAALANRCDQLQAELSAASSRVQELEQPQGADQDLREEQVRQLAARDQHLAELTEQLATRAQQHFLLAAERDDLQARLQRTRTDLSAMAQRRENQGSAPAEAERARRQAAAARKDDDMTELQRRVTGHREALQRAEAHRQVFECMLREREEIIDERDARLRSLQGEMARQSRDHAAELESAHAQPAAALAAASGPKRPVGQKLEAGHIPEAEPAANGPALLSAPDGPAEDLHAAMLTLQSQLRDQQSANEALRGDLAAAQLQLHEAISELGQSNAGVSAANLLPAPAVAELPSGQRLLVRTEGDAGIVHVLGRRTTIGRISANDLCIDTDFISRHHAVVLATDSGTVVEDLNSTNGVFVNNVRVTRHELHEGDLLTIGKTSFRYVLKPGIEPN